MTISRAHPPINCYIRFSLISSYHPFTHQCIHSSIHPSTPPSIHQSINQISHYIRQPANQSINQSYNRPITKQCISFCLSFSHKHVMKWKHFPRYWPFVRGIHRWIPLTMVSDAELWCFLWSAPNQTARRRWFETPSRSLWRHCNESIIWSTHILLCLTW